MPEFNMNEITLDYYREVFTSSTFVSTIFRSVGVSFIGSLLTAVLGILISWCIVTAFNAKGILFQITKLPMLVPFTVCSLCVITLVSSTGFIPRVLVAMGFQDASEWFSHVLYWPNSIGVILVFAFHLSSYFIYMMVDVMSRISSSLGEAARNLGASQWTSFRRVVLPYCMPTIRSTFIFCFVVMFGNYEVGMLVGSSTAKLLPVQAYMEYSNYSFLEHRPSAMVLNMVMLAIALVIIALLHIWDVHDNKKKGLA